jgi:hypothetical protein
MYSAVLCHEDGINFAFAQAKLKNKKARVQDKITSIVEFVIEKSKGPKNIGINLLIENCSKGDKKSIKNYK